MQNKIFPEKTLTYLTSFNKLAQLPTELPTDVNDTKKELFSVQLRKKARAKWYTKAIVDGLMLLDSKMHSYYEIAQNCNHTLIQEGKKIKGKYCNTRVCHVCNRVRTGKLMNGYIKPLHELGNIEFITLTVKNCKKEDLRRIISEMTKKCSNIVRVFNEKRNMGISGIRKLEVTYNEEKDTYHPHIHLLVDKGIGKEFIEEWLLRNPTANIKGQDCRKADQNSLNELFKYSTKFSAKIQNGIRIYLSALDIIMQSLYNKRTFQPFGKIRKISENIENIQVQEYEELEFYETMVWTWNKKDWYNIYAPEYNNERIRPLTGYQPPDYKIELIE